MKKTCLLFLALCLFFLFTNTGQIYAAKKLPQLQNRIKPTFSGGFSVTVKLRPDRKAVFIYFSNVQGVNSISYTLTYETNGKQEGAIGSVSPSERSTTRELLFGTCSSGVCRYHSNVINARLEITIESKSGKKSIKKYRLKV